MIGKKHILSGLLALALFFCLAQAPANAQSVDPAEAKAALQSDVDAVLTILRKPEYKNPATQPELLKQVEEKIYSIFDFTAFAAGTVGPRWRGFTPDEKTRLTDAFADLLRATYLSKFENYDGEDLLYTGETVKGSTVEVATIIRTTDNKQIPITYRMMKRDKWVVFDVIAEGMSLVQNYRSQFQDALIKETPDQLITRIKDQADKVRAKKVN